MTAKEVDALEMAILKAEQDAQKYANTEDGGTCNFDAPAIKIKATEKQLACMDWRVMKWGKRCEDGRTWFVVWLNLSGQGNRRTRMAEAAAESLKASGYETTVYYQMD
jgi:hypothetical protein